MSSKAKTVQSAKPLKTVRNVLVQPFKTKWPCVESDEGGKLLQLLGKIPKQLVVHGTNPVSHLLSKGLANALFITSDFHPQILGKQIIQMARRNSPEIQILALEKLTWGGSLEKLVAIRKISNKYPEVISELLKLMTDISKSKGYETEPPNSTSGGNRELKKEQSEFQDMPLEAIERLYLPRPAKNKRIFVPQVSIFAAKRPVDAENEDWGEYISFKRPRSEQVESDLAGDSKNRDKSAFKKPNDKLSRSYVPLTVNRVQGNPNRKAENKKK